MPCPQYVFTTDMLCVRHRLHRSVALPHVWLRGYVAVVCQQLPHWRSRLGSYWRGGLRDTEMPNFRGSRAANGACVCAAQSPVACVRWVARGIGRL
jgi:hypothetical protein